MYLKSFMNLIDDTDEITVIQKDENGVERSITCDKLTAANFIYKPYKDVINVSILDGILAIKIEDEPYKNKNETNACIQIAQTATGEV